MLVMPKSQQRWITPSHFFLNYDGDQKYLNMAGNKINKLKIKQYAKSEILFLDQVNLGEAENSVIEKLGDPFFIFQDYQDMQPYKVYSYGLKSGNNKLKVHMHFVDTKFSFGTITFNTYLINYGEISAHFQEKYNIPNFNILRDIIVDPSGNFIDFHLKHNFLVMMISRK